LDHFRGLGFQRTWWCAFALKLLSSRFAKAFAPSSKGAAF
jgi:hypothetical protein